MAFAERRRDMFAAFLRREAHRAGIRLSKQLSWPWPLLTAVALVIVLAERYSRRYGRNVVDDAMTSMQYAKQLALGNGLVFNIGERVEGYTNFAWVVLMAPIYWLSTRLGFDFVVAVVHLTELTAVGVVFLVFWISRKWHGANSLPTWLALGVLVADNSFTVWAILGLEVHLLALFMLLAIAALAHDGRLRWLTVGLALLGAHLTRPDAGLFCAVLLGNELLEAWLELRRGDRMAARRRSAEALLAGGVWVASYGAYFFWRYRYFGDLMPNTYYLKLGGHIDAWGRGLRYLSSFLRVRYYFPLLALLALFSLRRPVVRGVLSYNALHALYVVYVGGDFFSGHRFFVPELPQLALLIAVGVADAATRLRRSRAFAKLEAAGVHASSLRLMAVAAFAVLLAAAYRRGLHEGPLAEEVRAWGGDLTRQTKLFRWLRDNKLPGASVANTLIGHTGFYSEARVIDVCGVIDRFIAHSEVKNFGKGKAGHEKLASSEYILAKQPTYVALGAVDRDLWQHGYYLRADLPEDTFEGIWEKDLLPSTGTFLADTRVSFDGARPIGWVATGNAFENWPTRGHHRGQGDIVGSSGRFVNSYHPTLHDEATGSLTSPPFDLRGDLLLFRIAGGNEPDKLRVELLVDSVPVYATSGRQGDHMSRRAWDISTLRGRQATLRIIDDSTAKWGYLAVDDLVQWQRGAVAAAR
jgi:hypothetical protein